MHTDEAVTQTVLINSGTSTVCSNFILKVEKAVCNILYFRKYRRDIMKAQKNFFHLKR